MCFFSAPKVSQQAATPTPVVPAPVETADVVKEAGTDSRKIKRKRSGRDSLRIKRSAPQVNVPASASGVNI